MMPTRTKPMYTATINVVGHSSTTFADGAQRSIKVVQQRKCPRHWSPLSCCLRFLSAILFTVVTLPQQLGVQRRERLQSELASGVNNFFTMHRKMKPNWPVAKTEADLKESGKSFLAKRLAAAFREPRPGN